MALARGARADAELVRAPALPPALVVTDAVLACPCRVSGNTHSTASPRRPRPAPPVVAESSPPPEDREGTSPSPRPSPPPSPGYWEDLRCSELEKENRQFRFSLLKVRAKLRQTKVDLLDAEAEVSELFDK